MRPNRRRGVSKYRSARRFRKQSSRTKVVNIRPGLARGGIRL